MRSSLAHTSRTRPLFFENCLHLFTQSTQRHHYQILKCEDKSLISFTLFVLQNRPKFTANLYISSNYNQQNRWRVNIFTPYLHRLLADWQQLTLDRWRSEGKKQKNAWCVRAQGRRTRTLAFCGAIPTPTVAEILVYFSRKTDKYFLKMPCFFVIRLYFLPIHSVGETFFLSKPRRNTLLDGIDTFEAPKKSRTQKHRFHRKPNTTKKKERTREMRRVHARMSIEFSNFAW